MLEEVHLKWFELYRVFVYAFTEDPWEMDKLNIID